MIKSDKKTTLIIVFILIVIFSMLYLLLSKSETKNILLNKHHIEIYERNEIVLEVITETNNDLIWTSEDPTIAFVSSGKVVGNKEGRTKIIVKTKDGKTSDWCLVDVKKKVLDSLEFDKEMINLQVGEEEEIKPIIAPEDLSNENVAWESSDDTVASVSNGKIKALKEGIALITARVLNEEVTITVVVGTKADNIWLSSTKLKVELGKEEELKVTITPSDALEERIIWESSNPEVIEVDKYGRLIAKSLGEATITATSEYTKLKDTCQVEVVNNCEVKIMGSTITETSLGDGAILAGTVDIPTVNSSDLILSTNKEYFVSFDYQVNSGTNSFRIDLTHNDLPKTTQTATIEKKHYDWIFSSTNNNIKKCQLRFIDDIKENNEKDITVSNLLMGTIETRNVLAGDELGLLPSPTRNNYRFLGWYTDPITGTKVDSKTTINDNMTIYPHWQLEETYTEVFGGDIYNRKVTYNGRTFTDYKQQRMGGAIPKQGCGPVSLMDIISGYQSVDINDIVKISGLSTSFNSIQKAAIAFGFKTLGPYVYNSNDNNEAMVEMNTKLAIDHLKQGHHLIALVSQQGNGKKSCENRIPYAYSWGNHFIAIIGVKKDNETVIILNPSEGREEDGKMSDIIRCFTPGGGKGFIVVYK